jgi:MYXO-CTERM domain-containing protein
VKVTMTRLKAQLLLCAALFTGSANAAEQVLVLDGEAAAGDPDHIFVPFEVPAGIVEIEVRHEDLSDANILDFGLNDPDGFRGWSGSSKEPSVVTGNSASRGYLPGQIVPGEWKVVIGKAQIKEAPAGYHIEVVLRDVVTLPAQPEREPYQAGPPVEQVSRWYAGDFHVHSRESDDAHPTLEEIATFAKSRGLDFVEITDHNVHSSLHYFTAARAAHPDFLFVPGVEFTTYDGHGNGIGATQWVDHKIGLPGVTIDGAARAYADQNAVFSINHPVLDLGDACIGCAWKHALDPELVGAVEIATGGWKQTGVIFTERAIAFWDELCATGHHIAPIGGSDDHRAGVDLGAFQSPIGDPTTMVYAAELSAPGIVEGIRNGRTVVKLQGPDDPMIELSAGELVAGDTLTASGPVELVAKVTRGAGAAVRFVQDGSAFETVVVAGDPFEHEQSFTPPASGESRIRAEVLIDDKPRTVTSHVWLRAGSPDGGTASPDVSAKGGGCGCRLASNTGSGSAGGWALLVLAAMSLLRSYRPDVRRASEAHPRLFKREASRGPERKASSQRALGAR